MTSGFPSLPAGRSRAPRRITAPRARHAVDATVALLLMALAACSDDASTDGTTPGPPDAASPSDASADVPTGDSTPDDAADTADDAGMDAVEDPTPDAIDDVETADDATPDPDAPFVWPAPDAWTPNRGPGAPTTTYTEEQLGVNCAYYSGGELDTTDHHNLVVMYDGYLLMPWAPEWSGGGLTFYDISDPCDPVTVGTGFSPGMRESHSIGFSQIGGAWAVVDGMQRARDGGVQFWDVSDPTAPVAVSNVNVPGFFYPDAYARVTLSVFWQAPYVYAAGADNGIYIIDATDPREPSLVGQYTFSPILRAGQVHAVGDLLIVTAAEGARTALLDISDPADPQPIPGGDFLATDGDGTPREAYFTNIGNGYVYYARKSSGGGVMIWDIHDPSAPAYSGDYRSEGNGGYVFVKDDYAFVGESRFAVQYDISDHDDIREVRRFGLQGDLDTITPIGHIAFVAVDDEANPGEGTAAAPYATDPDTIPPRVTWVWPPDGADDLTPTSRIGVTFNEMVDVRSAFEGSVRLRRVGAPAGEEAVRGYVSTQENVVNFWPVDPLRPGTEYVFEIPAGGIVDYSGNAIEVPFTATYRTFGTAPE